MVIGTEAQLIRRNALAQCLRLDTTSIARCAPRIDPRHQFSQRVIKAAQQIEAGRALAGLAVAARVPTRELHALAKMGRSCPAHCMDLPSCPPARGDGQARLPWLKKQLKVVRTLLPPHPPPLNSPRLLLITTTYTHTEQLVRLEHLAASLAGEPNLLWLVVEDEVTTSPLVANLLSSREPPIPFVHLARMARRERAATRSATSR